MGTLKNILILIPHFGQGGAERSSAKIAEALSRNYNVTFCAFTDELPLSFDIGKASIVYLDHQLTDKQRTSKLRRWLGRYKALKAIKKK